jgi:hypothetical protein
MRHIAEQKKHENIAEYILFMWQMEDLLRGVSFDVDKLRDGILQEIPDEKLRAENVNWFKSLASKMKQNNVQVSGHLPETSEIINELAILQQSLLTVFNDAQFKRVYTETAPVLKEFRMRASQVPENDVETIFTALYGVLILKLAGKEISPETQEAVAQFKKFTQLLAKSYKDMKSGQLPLQN